MWEGTWPWTFMHKKCTYVWSAHKWRTWKVCKHVYFLWCIIVTQQQNQHTCTWKEKNHVVCRFHYPLPPMCETKILKPLQINGNYSFSQQYLQTQVNKIFQFKKDLEENDDISFSEYLPWWKYIYIKFEK